MAQVLIVDDDEGIRESLRYALEDAGHTVLEVPDGIQALKLLRESSRRMVVLVDLMMPGLDGAGVLGAVAADPQLSSQYAYIMMTANPRTLPLAFASLLRSLAVPYVAKPFDVDDLLALVEKAADELRRREAQDPDPLP